MSTPLVVTDMHSRVEEFCTYARTQHGFDPEVQVFQEGTKTAADAAAAIDCDVAQIASSIVVSTADGLAVVVTSGAHRVDRDAIVELLDTTTVSMADADAIKQTLGWTIGGVPPFCHASDVPILIDDTLFEYDEIWAAAGTPNAVFPLTPTNLQAFSGGRRATVHERK